MSGAASAGVRDPVYVEADPTEAEPGSTLVLRGGGWDDAPIEFTIAGRDVGDTTVGPNGYFQTRVQVPELPDGEYTLTARGVAEGSPYVQRLTLDVSDDFIRGAIPSLILLGLVLLALVLAAWFFVFRPRAARKSSEG